MGSPGNTKYCPVDARYFVPPFANVITLARPARAVQPPYAVFKGPAALYVVRMTPDGGAFVLTSSNERGAAAAGELSGEPVTLRIQAGFIPRQESGNEVANADSGKI
jgi:hypothetical protein